jgi:hypothetical protein
MRFWSEGLGDRELVIALGASSVERKDDYVVLKGIVVSPAPWEYEVKIQFADWTAILTTATTREACGFIARRVTLGSMASMGVSIVKFIALLGFFRVARLLRQERAGGHTSAEIHLSDSSSGRLPR